MTSRLLGAAAAALAVATALSACGSSGGSHSAGGSGARLQVRSGVLVGSNGHTLYYNTVDTGSRISCTGACASTWPPVSGGAKLGSGLSASQFGTVKRPDGSSQETWQGHPLYEFAGDHSGGQQGGNGLRDGGGTWHAVTMGTAPAPTSAPPSSGGYAGY
jgi:predicted lipoprotein with Yx(FWY)xxD motif